MAIHRDAVVIGASAGGLTALSQLVSGIPAQFPGAIFVVLHIAPYAVSRLPQILQRVSQLPVMHAEHEAPIHAGHIYIAPPDQHLLVRQDRVELSRGPRENRFRPAIDPLFRSAARAYGPRVIGVVLSGALYDGSAGLVAVKNRGGLAIVQDPDEATVDAMPRSALRMTEVDHIAPAAEIGPLLNRLVSEPAPEGVTMADPEETHLTGVIAEVIRHQGQDDRPDALTIYTCPDCGGSLFQDGEAGGFRCHVGHAYGPDVLLDLKGEEVESTLWACVRMLTEKATLTRQLATRTRERRSPLLASRIDEQAVADERYVQVIRELLEAIPGPTEQVATILQSQQDGPANA